MNKISVKICMGTTCFVMGAAALQELLEIIPKKYGDAVEISGVPCLNFCNSTECEYSKAPYVTVDNDVVQSATVENVLVLIEEKLKNEKK